MVVVAEAGMRDERGGRRRKTDEEKRGERTPRMRLEVEVTREEGEKRKKESRSYGKWIEREDKRKEEKERDEWARRELKKGRNREEVMREAGRRAVESDKRRLGEAEWERRKRELDEARKEWRRLALEEEERKKNEPEPEEEEWDGKSWGYKLKESWGRENWQDRRGVRVVLGASLEESRELQVPAAASTPSEAPPSREEVARRIRGMSEGEFERWRREMGPEPRREKEEGKGKGVGKRTR